jgi:hypothetical protein
MFAGWQSLYGGRERISSGDDWCSTHNGHQLTFLGLSRSVSEVCGEIRIALVAKGVRKIGTLD